MVGGETTGIFGYVSQNKDRDSLIVQQSIPVVNGQDPSFIIICVEHH